MRLDPSTLVLAGLALTLMIVAYFKDPSLPLIGTRNGLAMLAFTGPRVVQQTTREKLPEDFGLAESNQRFGHVDAIVARPELRPYLGRVLTLFRRNGN